MKLAQNIKLKHVPELDPTFVPAALWNREFQRLVERDAGSQPLAVALERADGTRSVQHTKVLPHEGANEELNIRYTERLLKFLLWQKGGYKITLGGDKRLASAIKAIYHEDGERFFDHEFMGDRVYERPLEVHNCAYGDTPDEEEAAVSLGRHMDGCRVGFDLGGSDRKAAAVQDGKVLFTEEVPWDPYFEKDPQYHIQGIRESIRKAAEKLPRIDAIGGSAAGVYVNNRVRVASLFRGVPPENFELMVRDIFLELKKEFGDVPFEVVNDGEVTALAGSISMKDNAVLGISMGTSLAGGYVTPQGNITPWLNELAFAPVDYQADAPADEWSGDLGCGVQYFSQQAVARLAPLAGFEFPQFMPFPEMLKEVQKAMAGGDSRARKVYETIGCYFGYTIVHWSDYYDVRNLLVLGRVTSGEGGNLVLSKAEEVLRDEFPDVADKVTLRTPSEQDKRHGQAVAAASLPATV